MFKNAINLVEIFGFKIRLDPSWLLIAALIVWSLSSSYFPSELPGYSHRSYILIATIAMLGLFVSIILHEMAHSLVARQFGLDVGSITLFIFGGVAELEQEPRDPRSEFWIAIAGPVMSLLLASAAYGLSAFLGLYPTSGVLVSILGYLWLINLLLATFNLVPAFPLDGGRVFRAALWHYKQDLVAATRIASRTGTAFGLFLVVLGISGLVFSFGVGGLWYIVIGFFIISASRNSYQQLLMKTALKDQTVASLMTKTPITASVKDKISHLVNEIMLGQKVSFVPVLDGDELVGFVDLNMVHGLDQANRKTLRVGDVYAPLSKLNSISPENHAEEVFQRMAESGNRKLMVVRGDRLLGIISLTDLMNYLAIRTSINQQN